MEDRKTNELSDEKLNEVAGGGLLGDIKTAFSEIDYEKCKVVNPPTWACPSCKSWDVTNYDPGMLYQMRVKCHNCGFSGARDGTPDQ